jgi:biopolymer transport protein ExbD
MKIRREFSDEKNELQMTSMIDVVFLLLIFFIATFKISAQEGDFSVRMPLAEGSGAPPDTTDLPIKLRLTADTNGVLTDITVNDAKSFGTNWQGVREFVLDMTGGALPDETDEGPEVEIDIDYNLQYRHVIEAFTAVTGKRIGDDIIPIVERVKFAPPRRPL